jgi:hypothetical protein
MLMLLQKFGMVAPDAVDAMIASRTTYARCENEHTRRLTQRNIIISRH